MEELKQSEDLQALIDSFLESPVGSLNTAGKTLGSAAEVDEAEAPDEVSFSYLRDELDEREATLEEEAFELVAEQRGTENPPSKIPPGLLTDESSAKYLRSAEEDKIAFTDTERDILEATLKGQTPEIIAVQLALPKSYVRSFLLKKEVKEYIRDLKEAKSQLLQLRALDIYSQIIDSRVADMVEAGEDFSSLTHKDTVDVIRSAVELASSIDKARQSAQDGDVYVSILQQVTR